MEAANPLRWWLLAVGLAATIGCHNDGTSATLGARGQAPSDPRAPVGPLAPISPVSPAGPVIPGAPVVGSPVASGPVVPDVQKASYSTTPSAPNDAAFLKDGVPQIKVVALVGATNLVTDQEVIEAVRQHLEQLHGLEGHARKAREAEMYTAELRKIIERELIIDEMYIRLKKGGRMAAIDDIKDFATKAADHTVRGIRKSWDCTSDEDFTRKLRTQGLTQPVIRRQLERQIMADEYVRNVLKEKGRSPSLGDIREYFDRHPEDFKSPDKVKWLDIFISVNKHPSPQAAYDHAMKIQQQAASGSDFVALVKEHDNGLAVGTMGVGVGSKRGEIQPPDVEPTVWALRPGEVSQLIQTPTGYHIVKIAEREYAGLRSFDAKLQGEIRDKLVKQYRETEYKRLIEELWRKGPVRLIDNP